MTGPRLRAATLAVALAAGCGGSEPVAVGSKDFIEQDVLAEILAQELEERGVEVRRRFHFGGTNLTHQALIEGDLDLYVEYTGTMLTAVLDRAPIRDADSVYTVVEAAYLDRWGLVLGPPLGFENTFALVVRAADADSLGLATIGDLAAVAGGWTAGFGPEFMSRPDGYPGLREAYGLDFAQVRQMDLGLLYRALDQGGIDVAVANSTDGQIAALDLRVLTDNRRWFPPYQAVPVVRRETIERQPVVWDVLQSLAGTIPGDEMRELNRRVVMEGGDVPRVVRRWRATRPPAGASDTTASPTAPTESAAEEATP